MDYKVFWKATDRAVQMTASDVISLAGYKMLGIVSMPPKDDAIALAPGSLVMYQLVQDLLYKESELSLQEVNITWPGYVPISGVDVTDMNMVAGTTQRTTGSILPTQVSDSRMTYFIQDEKIAVVSPLGYVSAIAPGTTKIKVASLADPTIYDWATITVTPKLAPAA